jgi:GT2 family glycosyltransferase/glycosyltransferase involved in cell wall biosynthesis
MKKVLLMVDYHAQDAAWIRAIQARYPGAEFVTIKDQGADEAFYRELGLATIWDYHIFWSSREKFALMRRISSSRFDAAVLLGRTPDLRQMALIWSSGAKDRRFLQLRAQGRVREREIRFMSFPGPILLRGAILAVFFPVLILLRIFFKLAERGRFRSSPAPDAGPPLGTDASPPVSVVIPNYNGLDMLKECLPSVLEAIRNGNADSEVIVVDDASTDRSAAFIRENYPQVALIPLENNRGFAGACHAGIERARHDLVVLLNSDIAVTPDFLPPLTRHFADEKVFAVQAKAFGWDRSSFNFGLNVGHIEDGCLRIWNEIDAGRKARVYRTTGTLYAMGGAMVFDRRKFRALGGFDPLFRPFRWEDIDLSYRALKWGWKVYYEPESTVFHKHHGTLDRVFKADYLNIIEQKNELLFVWKNIHERAWIGDHFRRLPGLLLLHLVSGKYNFAKALLRACGQLPAAWRQRARTRKQAVQPDSEVMDRSLRAYEKFLRRGGRQRESDRKQILIVNPVFPYPPVDGGKMRVYHIIREMAPRHDIHLLCYIEPGQKKDIAEMKKICREVDTVDWPQPYGCLERRTEAAFPMYYRGYYSDAMRDRLRGILRDRDIDLVQCEFDKTMYYVTFASGYPTVYVEHDVSPLILSGGKNPPQPGWRKHLHWVEWLKSMRWEVKMGRQFTRIVVLSEEDRRLIRRFLPEKNVSFVRHGTRVEEFLCDYHEVREKSLVFIGSYHHYPNRDAVLFFLREVWPLVRRKHADARFRIIGSHAGPEILSLARDTGVEVLGFVEDVRPHVKDSMVFIAPMRKGRGMRGKILEAMVMARPVVATSLGIQGAEVRDGEHLLVADSPSEFARCIDRLFADPQLRRRLALQGQALVQREYDWSRAAAQMEETYGQLI